MYLQPSGASVDLDTFLGPFFKSFVRPFDPIFNNPFNLSKLLNQRSKLLLSFKLHTMSSILIRTYASFHFFFHSKKSISLHEGIKIAPKENSIHFQ